METHVCVEVLQLLLFSLYSQMKTREDAEVNIKQTSASKACSFIELHDLKGIWRDRYFLTNNPHPRLCCCSYFKRPGWMIKWFFADLLQSFSCLTVLSSQQMLTGHQTVETGVLDSIFLMALVYYLLIYMLQRWMYLTELGVINPRFELRS